jgi:mono/diheme cytochrome c family protein
VHAIRQKGLPEAAAKVSPQYALSFTAEQAEQGKVAYQHNCQDCHGSTLDNGEFGGPPLRGSYFSRHWTGGSLAALYAFTKSRMPPDRPGALSDKVYADLVAYMLAVNGYKPGDKELPTDSKAQQSISLKRD